MTLARLDVKCVRTVFNLLFFLLGSLIAVGSETASTSSEFFALLAQQNVDTIYLNNDIVLNLKDAPTEPINITRSVTILPSAQAPYLASLAANYISNKVRLRPNVTIRFVRIILSGILRGTGQHLDLLSKSDGGAVLYINTINHRAACLPFDQFYAKLSSLPPPLAAAGMADTLPNTPRNFTVRNSSFCWSMANGKRPCMSPYLDMVTYGTYNEISDVLIPANGGYNSFFINSYGVCDKPVDSACLQTRGADLCLAAALAANPVAQQSGDKGAGSTDMGMAIGLGVGLGGALLLLVMLVLHQARTHWRHRKSEAGQTAEAVKLSAGAMTPNGVSASAHAAASGLADLEKGSDGMALLGTATESAEDGSRGRVAALGSATAAGGGGGDGGSRRRQAGKGELAAPTTAGSTGVSGSGDSPSSSTSTSGVTIEASSMTMMVRNAEAAGSSGLGEVEVARLNLMANAAKGRAGRTAPLDVKVLQLLGQGSFGKVYKGIWHGTLVALKAQVLPPSLSGDARRRHMAVMEAAISSAINHPAIVQTYCYSFRPIKDSVSRAVIKHARSALPTEEARAAGTEPVSQGENAAAADSPERATPGDEDYGHELLLVLEYCDGGSLRAALDKGVLHRGRPWPWDWRRVIQQQANAAVGTGAGAGDPRAAVAAGKGWPASHANQPWNLQQQQQQQQLQQQFQLAWAGLSANDQAAQLLSAALGGGGAGGAAAAAAAGGGAVGGVGGGIGRVPVAPVNTPDCNLQASPATTGNVSSPSSAAAEPVSASSGAPVPTLPPPPSKSHSNRTAAAPRTVHATEMASNFWPELASYEPDFTQGAFEVLVPASGDKDGGDGGAAATARGGGDVVVQEVAGLAAGPDAFSDDVSVNARMKDMLAGAPTAASSFVSSFSAVSDADAAAAAAAADRLAMMYLLQQAAAAVAMAGPPSAVGGYAKLLADFVSASNISGIGSFSGLATSDAAAALLKSVGSVAIGASAAAAAGGSGGPSSSDVTIVTPPADVLAAAGVGAVSPAASGATPASGEAQGATADAAAKAACSLGSDGMSGSAAAECGDGGSSARPQPAVRYGLMLALAADVASGLMHLHAHGVVHGDVKASNVLLKQIVVSDAWEAAGRAMDATRAATGTGGTGGTGVSSLANLEAPSAQEPGQGAGPQGPQQQPQPHQPQPQPQPQQQASQLHGLARLVESGLEASHADRGPRLGLCAKVSDFGLSTMLSASNTDTHISATTAAGSLSHMSPELLLCGHVSKANDVYAFGILLFELFTGERAWEGMPRALLPARVALEGWRPVFPPHTPAGFRQLAERCWQADPAKRPHFEDIVGDIRALRDAAVAAGLLDWVPVPNPHLAFLQQLMQQRRGGGPPLAPAPTAATVAAPTPSAAPSPAVVGSAPGTGQAALQQPQPQAQAQAQGQAQGNPRSKLSALRAATQHLPMSQTHQHRGQVHPSPPSLP